MYQIYTINSCNNHKKTSFKSFHANFLKINVYHYSKLSRDSCLKYIQKIHATTTKKPVSSFFMLIS